jgi:hypothetical protein
MRVIAVSDVHGAVTNSGGLDGPHFGPCRDDGNGRGYQGGEPVDRPSCS